MGSIRWMKSVLIVLLLGVIAFSCKDGKGYRTSSGLIFYVYGNKDQDSTLTMGSVLKMNVKKFVNDSLVGSTYYGFPKYEQVMPGAFYPYEPAEVYPFFHKGDSIVLIQDADSLLRRSLFYSVPPYVKAGDKIVTHFKVLDVFPNDSLARLDQEKAYPLAISRNRETGAARLQAYLDRNNIEATLTADTVFIEMVEKGTGPPLDSNDVATIRFTAMTLSGRVIGGNADDTAEPMDYPLNSGYMPVGIEEGMNYLSVGDHARLYIPAMKAFGPSPPPGMEEGFLDLIFDVKVLGKKDMEDDVGHLGNGE